MASNMYSHSVCQWNPFVGCNFNCVYCKNSFQAQLKRWAKKNCQKCYNFKPHEHPERLEQPLPGTGYMQFIFTCSMGDISFCSTEYLEKIVDRIRREKDKTFLVQSKNPRTFGRVSWPNNVILGTTIETNIEGCPTVWPERPAKKYILISEAPMRCIRWANFMQIKHPLKMVTVEPVLNFGDNLLEWIKDLNPCMVWLGYDSKNNNLPEPPIEKVKELHWQLSKMGIVVMLKKIREYPDGKA